MRLLILLLAILYFTVPTIATEAHHDDHADITHAQMVWLYALEWCESAGRKDNINENDTDGTPSYFSYQFKPSTLKMYGDRYGMIGDEDIMQLIQDYDLQRAIVERMLHDERVRWNREFPGCTKKIGLPPRY